MFEDIINKDEILTPSKQDIIDALKWNLNEKDKLMKQLVNDIDEKDRKIKNLEHEVEYLTNL